MSRPPIVNVTEKVRAFWQDHADDRDVWSIRTSYSEDHVGEQPRVIGKCEIVTVSSGIEYVVACAYGTRALRPPIPGATGEKDTRDPDRAMTQAIGRALGQLGYASGESLEGDTDEPDRSQPAPLGAASPSRERQGVSSGSGSPVDRALKMAERAGADTAQLDRCRDKFSMLSPDRRQAVLDWIAEKWSVESLDDVPDWAHLESVIDKGLTRQADEAAAEMVGAAKPPGGDG